MTMDKMNKGHHKGMAMVYLEGRGLVVIELLIAHTHVKKARLATTNSIDLETSLTQNWNNQILK